MMAFLTAYPTARAVVFLLVTMVTRRAQSSCDDVLHNPDVRFFDIRLPPMDVPRDLTTYTCQYFELPIPSNTLGAGLPNVGYHAVAFEPIIANKDVVHHMILFGCPDHPHLDILPHQCSGQDNKCRTFLMQWSKGVQGRICSPPNAGVKFGDDGVQSLALQVHWNNANRTAGLRDYSGVRVYYTRALRVYDLGNLQVGQNDLEIPAGQGHVEQTGSCSSECTSNWLRHPIYLTRGHIHMHYLGSGGSLEVVRGGSVVSTVMMDHSFRYDTPPTHDLSTPVEVRPGDELRLTCFYNSTGIHRTFFWGEGSDGEMCYAFISYYPKVEKFDQCIQFDKYDICSPTGFAPLGECVFGGLVRSFTSGLADEIVKQCTDDVTDDVKLRLE